ncbi:MAG: hypothetical protein CML29_17285 [Rhizobiales bacterium]|nr:hypothetical protein [Hyphomicrobiales bacterium]MBA68665.1 hypothetical protein [Hyphomicrobiales bacterium]|tara:strand:+ start:314 stop:652 length:339 start_codon:yes stop_codon:yes gene_type:complete
MDLKQHLLRQMAFSRATFGTGSRTNGVVDHIRKELEEVQESHGCPSEWVDVVILGLDGLTRSLSFVIEDQDEVADEACRMIVDKQSRNERRDWPDWRTADPDKAIEHDRSAE